MPEYKVKMVQTAIVQVEADSEEEAMTMEPDDGQILDISWDYELLETYE